SHEIVDFCNDKNIVFGKNGSGKTSMIEAIFMLTHGRSFRSSDSFIPLYGQDYFSLKGEVGQKDARHTIEQVYSKSKKKKRIRIDNVLLRNSVNLDMLKTVLFVQDDLSLLDGAPDIKRRFLDTLFMQVDKKYYQTLNKYQKILESRNFVLKQDESSQKEKNLEILDQPLVEYGSFLISKRVQYINCLSVLFSRQRKQREIKEHLTLAYGNDILESYSGDKDNDINHIASRFFRILHHNRKKEKLSGFTLFGPHRDNLIFKNERGIEAKEVLSAGEKKKMVLVMKFSEFEFLSQKTGQCPIVLMDDIFIELDDQNTHIFQKWINSLRAQFIITAREKDKFQSIEFKKEISLNGKNL
ncbi:MAG: DNA replication and repair protein RecF, partial [Spirochaetes bacterium]|nr:DNA replication and repair protein RecF [Spirochaetota bacterium]